jgi:hypothetical protein
MLNVMIDGTSTMCNKEWQQVGLGDRGALLKALRPVARAAAVGTCSATRTKGGREGRGLRAGWTPQRKHWRVRSSKGMKHIHSVQSGFQAPGPCSASTVVAHRALPSAVSISDTEEGQLPCASGERGGRAKQLQLSGEYTVHTALESTQLDQRATASSHSPCQTKRA